jgi:hypothetical protein
MQRALFAPRRVDAGGQAVEHDDGVVFDQLDDLALDVGEAFLDQRGAHVARRPG